MTLLFAPSIIMVKEYTAMRFILAADAASIHKIAQGRYFMDSNHCYNVYFRWWALPHQRNVQGFGVVFSKTLHPNKANLP